jgi:hypothetical protein
MVPHGILLVVTTYAWWPKSLREFRNFGFVVAYLLIFLIIMHYVFKAF